MLNGIDISDHNGPDVDYTGKDIIFIKATEATGYTNEDMKAQLDKARKEGKRVGFYHYAWPVNSADKEVAYMHQAIASLLQPGDMVGLDWEFYGAAGANVTPQIADDYKDAWFLAAEKTFVPHRCVLYTNLDRWFHWDINSNCGDGLWIADITTAGQPRIQHPWTGHQYDSSGNLDKDVWNFADLAEYDKWAGVAPKPLPKPQPLPKPAPSAPTVHVGHLIYAMHRDPHGPNGARGPFADEVKLLEEALARTGWLDWKFVDGSYGTMTIGNGDVNGQGGCKGFQKKHSYAINPDGWLGVKELTLLFHLAGMAVQVVL